MLHKCAKCDHTAEVQGFCPKDGSALVEAKASSELEVLLSHIDTAVKEGVSREMKAAGFDGSRGPGFGLGTGETLDAAKQLEYVKSILSDKDKAHMATLDGPEEEKRFLSKAKIAYFIKNLVAFNVTKDPGYLTHVKALATVDADGGYTIPQEFRALLVRDQKDKPYLRNLVTVLPMSTNYMELPTLVNDVKTSWGSENTAITTTTAAFGQLTFTPYRLNSLIYLSRELVSDSALNIVDLITRLFREAIGREEDRVIVAGSGSGQPKGIFQETLLGIDNLNDDSTIADNIRALPFRLPQVYRSNARWLGTGLAFQKIAQLKATTTGQYLLGTFEGGTPTRLVGYPFQEQNDMSVDKLLFGDFSYYYLADREQISIESTSEGAGTFEKHQVAIKVVERIDGKVALTNAFRVITNCGFD